MCRVYNLATVPNEDNYMNTKTCNRITDDLIPTAVFAFLAIFLVVFGATEIGVML